MKRFGPTPLSTSILIALLAHLGLVTATLI